MPKQVNFVWSTAMTVASDIERWIREKDGKTIYLRLKQPDLLRLTRLQVWSYRHRVPVFEILSLLVPVLRAAIKTRQKNRYGLGVSIASLTGKGTEKILMELIAKTYSEGEHIAEWRERERERQLAAELMEEREGLAVRTTGPLTVLDADSPKDFVNAYSRRVIANRQRARLAYCDSKRRELKYRSNPWN